MKVLIFLFLTLFALRAYCSDGPEFSYAETPEYAKPNLIDVLQIQTELESQGYWPVDLSNDQKLKFLGIDQAFFDPANNKTVLLKFGLRVSDEKILGKLIKMNGDFLFHGTVADGIPYALYFIDHSELEAKNVVKPLGLKENFSALNFFIPQAQASCPKSINRFFSQVDSALGLGAGAQRIWNCGLAAKSGAQAGVNGIGASLRKLVTDPAEFWRSTKESFRQLGQFIRHIDREIANFISTMSGLDTDTKLQIACTLGGEILPSVILGAVTGAALGPAIAKAAPLLALRLSQIKEIATTLALLSIARKTRVFKRADKVIESLVRCEM